MVYILFPFWYQRRSWFHTYKHKRKKNAVLPQETRQGQARKHSVQSVVCGRFFSRLTSENAGKASCSTSSSESHCWPEVGKKQTRKLAAQFCDDLEGSQPIFETWFSTVHSHVRSRCIFSARDDAHARPHSNASQQQKEKKKFFPPPIPFCSSGPLFGLWFPFV